MNRPDKYAEASGSGAVHANLNLGDSIPSSAKVTITQDAQRHEDAVPIHLPTIYINPYVVPKEETPKPPAPTPTPEPRKVKENSSKPPKEKDLKDYIKPATVVQPVIQQVWERRPHPLLWVTLGLSIVALVLGVPKGSLPTLTGRHKTLRSQEILVAERLQLLSQLSTFLPPPLSGLLTSDHLSLAQFHAVKSSLHQYAAVGAAAEGKTWWNVQDLGAGASVLTAQRDGNEREVWVLQTPTSGIEDGGDRVLLSALTGSLVAREKLLAELATCRAPRALPSVTAAGEWSAKRARDEEDGWREHARWHDREAELEERERQVLKREQWVVDEMRKMSERSRAQAAEIQMEERITDRLKYRERV